MNTHQSFTMPTRTEIDNHLAAARKLRSEYIARSVKSGFAWVGSLFTRKTIPHKAAV